MTYDDVRVNSLFWKEKMENIGARGFFIGQAGAPAPD
jgi:hypothetical protein